MNIARITAALVIGATVVACTPSGGEEPELPAAPSVPLEEGSETTGHDEGVVTVTGRPDPHCPPDTDQGPCIIPRHEGPHSDYPLTTPVECSEDEDECYPLPGDTIDVVCKTEGQELSGFDDRLTSTWFETSDGDYIFAAWTLYPSGIDSC